MHFLPPLDSSDSLDSGSTTISHVDARLGGVAAPTRAPGRQRRRGRHSSPDVQPPFIAHHVKWARSRNRNRIRDFDERHVARLEGQLGCRRIGGAHAVQLGPRGGGRGQAAQSAACMRCVSSVSTYCSWILIRFGVCRCGVGTPITQTPHAGMPACPPASYLGIGHSQSVVCKLLS